MLIDDLLQKNLPLILCGTAPSTASFQAKAYYAHPGNKFYQALYHSKLTPIQLKPKEYHKLLSYGIGLTDLNKTQYGLDSTLHKAHFDIAGLEEKLHHYQPSWLAFTSKRAAQEFFNCRKISYGEQKISFAKTNFFVLPSPSGLAGKYWDITIWQRLAEKVKHSP